MPATHLDEVDIAGEAYSRLKRRYTDNRQVDMSSACQQSIAVVNDYDTITMHRFEYMLQTWQLCISVTSQVHAYLL